MKQITSAILALAAAGAGIAALSDNEKKKAAAKVREAYDREYKSCLQGKEF
jgi:VIT1/CCC1 family predicted Fe2+/Mn2+ transporter